MNQIQSIQAQKREKEMLDKANFLVELREVRKSSMPESRNIWRVSSYSTPKKWYIVKWDQNLDDFICACKGYKHSSDNKCLHILACAIFEGSEE
jgi:hypothetical protein